MISIFCGRRACNHKSYGASRAIEMGVLNQIGVERSAYRQGEHSLKNCKPGIMDAKPSSKLGSKRYLTVLSSNISAVRSFPWESFVEISNFANGFRMGYLCLTESTDHVLRERVEAERLYRRGNCSIFNCIWMFPTAVRSVDKMLSEDFVRLHFVFDHSQF